MLFKYEGISQKDIAQRFRVKPSLVASLIRSEKLGKNDVSKLEQKGGGKESEA